VIFHILRLSYAEFSKTEMSYVLYIQNVYAKHQYTVRVENKD